MYKFEEKGLNVNFQTLLSDGSNEEMFLADKKYNIPVYQRPYSWRENEVTKLLEDIIESYEEKEEAKFLSTIQLYFNGEEYDIIDGQQRLTTLYLILLALSQVVNNKIEINFNVKIGEPNKIHFDNKNKDVSIKNIIDIFRENKTNTNLYTENYQIILNYINDLKGDINSKIDLNSLFEHISQNVYFIVFVINGCKHKYGIPEIIQMFNTLNTTGLDLNVSDLFKIEFAEICKNNDKKSNEEIISCINDIYTNTTVKNIKNEDLIRLYQDIICSYTSDENGNSYDKGLRLSTNAFFENLFNQKNESIKLEVVNPLLSIVELEKIAQLVMDFNDFYDRYKQCDTKHFSRWLLWATRYGRFWTFPYTYIYYNNYVIGDEDKNEKIFEDALDVTEQFAKLLVVFSINQDRVISELYTFISKQIYNKFNLQNKEKIINLIQDKKVINDRWWTKEGYDSKTVFLNRILKNLDNKWLICFLIEILNVNKIKLKNDNTNVWKNLYDLLWNPKDEKGNENKNCKPDVEHIFARKKFEDWNGEDKEIAEGIGNLMFLEGNINRSISDDLVNKKEKGYTNSYFSLAAYNHNADNWSNNESAKEEIDKRGKILSEQIINYIYS